nr:hypothetical protein B0A51_09791 [Rachicladosporium sp. CCFEE 5018]
MMSSEMQSEDPQTTSQDMDMSSPSLIPKPLFSDRPAPEAEEPEDEKEPEPPRAKGPKETADERNKRDLAVLKTMLASRETAIVERRHEIQTLERLQRIVQLHIDAALEWVLHERRAPTAKMQGFNMGRYHPPDAPSTNPNTLHRRRAPGTLSKSGTQTVRFEMPFAVWCSTCPKPTLIPQGVRFNAEKKKVGMYFSTPIWEFRMKHNICGGAVDIRTDPKTTQYLVVSGGKARDYGEDVTVLGGPVLSEKEKAERQEDAFAALEGKVEEKAVVLEGKKRVEELFEGRERDWRDTWSANRRLREGFRRERKVLKREEEGRERLKEKFGIEVEVQEEIEEDRQRAKLVQFGETDDRQAGGAELFLRTPGRISTRERKVVVSKSKSDALRRQLVSNTRAAIDPFG